MSETYPEWMLQLVDKIAEFEEGHPGLYRLGEPVAYRKAVEGAPTPAFENGHGYLVGELWCLDDVLRAIPADLRTAARYYQMGKEAGRGEQALQSP